MTYFISEIVRVAHKKGYKVELYGFAIPEIKIDVDVFGESTECRVDVITYFESKLIEKFVEKFNKKPIVGTNGLVK